MEILSVTLKNFKTHRDRIFQFHPGTNAICGENGAGKTSILEAIAWTLFNYRGSYRKEDLIRNGSRSAQATIRFISSRDQRTYDIQRCTNKGYTLFDPQLDQRLPYSRIDEEVLPWLREHLGVISGTDLPRLFENTIGVPQGMLTSDFLLSGEKRRRVFDSILKVEEYKETAQGLGALQKYAEGQVNTLERDLVHYDTLLKDRPEVEAQYTRIQQDIHHNETHFKKLEQQLASLHQQKVDLDTSAKTVQALEQQLQTLTIQVDGAKREHHLREEAVVGSRQAIQICKQYRSSYERYLDAEAQLKTLQAQQQEQVQLTQQKHILSEQIAQIDRELATITEKLRQVTVAEQTIASLDAAIAQQTDLEQQKREVESQLQTLQRLAIEKDTLTRHLQRLRQTWKDRSQAMKQIQSLQVEIQAIPDLEQQCDRLQAQISRVEVAKQFEAELRELVTQTEAKRDRHHHSVQSIIPRLQALMKLGAHDLDTAPTHPDQQLVSGKTTIPETFSEKFPKTVSKTVQEALKAVIPLLESGVTLTGDVSHQLHDILADLATQLSPQQLNRQHYALKQRLNNAYQYQGEWNTLAERQTQLETIQAEGEQTQAQIDTWTTQLAVQDAVQAELTQLEQGLQQLNDPRKQRELLQRELSQKDGLLQTQATLHGQKETLHTQIQSIDDHLAQFFDITAQLEQQQQEKQTHYSGYSMYLQHQQVAAQMETVEAALAVSLTHITQLQTEYTSIHHDHQQALEDYDPNAQQQVEQEYITVRSQIDQLRGSLPQQQRLLVEMKTRLNHLAEAAEKRDRTQNDLLQRQKYRDFITFSRSAYKEAGPRITERYVQTISAEADRLFRELLNRQNVALTWTRDYEIVVQEGAHPRRFINLSGGEQMCAALAVRLALLRVLADIDIAFFDEPTTNMDRPRRERLAEAIANLRTFHQLFVISHDDTFEQFTEHVVLVQRES